MAGEENGSKIAGAENGKCGVAEGTAERKNGGVGVLTILQSLENKEKYKNKNVKTTLYLCKKERKRLAEKGK
ncbi:MAG: hypothetical protein IJP02_05495 [Oscillospiraceae bacterium]|nr:hypothetical protein [Oscillospiraceae bacterium]